MSIESSDDGVYRFKCEACDETRTVDDHDCPVPTYDLVSVGYMGDQMEIQSDGYGAWVSVEDLPDIRARVRTACKCKCVFCRE